jgi:hypothetical protein
MDIYHSVFSRTDCVQWLGNVQIIELALCVNAVNEQFEYWKITTNNGLAV